MMKFIRRLLHMFLDVVIPPTLITFLIFYVPTAFFIQTFLSFFTRKSYNEPRNKVVLLTGATSGIGKHMAFEFARRNAKLVLVGLNEMQLREVSRLCANLGSPAAYACPADLSKQSECKKIVDYTKETCGKLDYLICNAGITPSFFWEDLQSPKAFKSIMDVNFWGYIWTAMYALPELEKSRGSILANSSIEAFMPIPRHSIYNASKAAVLQFFDTLRNEPIGRTVKVTIVLPGPTESGITQGRFVKETGKMEVDEDRRDETIGPQFLYDVETCALEMVKGVINGDPYLVLPRYWKSVAVMRLIAPELISFLLRTNFLPFWNQKPFSKIAVDVTGRKPFYEIPPTQQDKKSE